MKISYSQMLPDQGSFWKVDCSAALGSQERGRTNAGLESGLHSLSEELADMLKFQAPTNDILNLLEK